MGRFRKKPVVISAEQLTGDLECIPDGVVARVNPPEPIRFFVETLEGKMEAKVGDWIITGVNGEKYPSKPDIFEKTYDRVEPEESIRPDCAARNKRELLGALVASLLDVRDTARATQTCESCMGMTGSLSDAIEASDCIERKLKETL